MTKQSEISQIPKLRVRVKSLTGMREQAEQTLAKSQNRLAELLAEAGLSAVSAREKCKGVPGACDYQALIVKCENYLKDLDAAIKRAKLALAHAEASALVSLVLKPTDEFVGYVPPNQETQEVIH